MGLLSIIYFISVINAFNTLNLTILIVLTFCVGIGGITGISLLFSDLRDNNNKSLFSIFYNKAVKKTIKKLLIFYVISVTLVLFAPNKSEMYAMLALSKYVNTEITKTGEKGLKILNIKLDELIGDNAKIIKDKK